MRLYKKMRSMVRYNDFMSGDCRLTSGDVYLFQFRYGLKLRNKIKSHLIMDWEVIHFNKPFVFRKK